VKRSLHGGVAAIFGQDVDVGRGVSDLLVTALVKDGTYSVIERNALNKILAEQNFSNSDRANPTSAARIGKLLGVDAIIVGSITQFGNETKNTGVGGSGGALGGFGIGGFSHKKSKAIVGLTARMIDVDTAEISYGSVRQLLATGAGLASSVFATSRHRDTATRSTSVAGRKPPDWWDQSDA
jgi:curli biogenesis system outer membrane secretion channel CsgG